MKKQKEKRRSRVKYPNLTPRYNVKVRQESIDQDYLEKLSPEEMAWLDRFMGEYNNASFKNDGTDLHQNVEHKKEIYNKNNARNRCLYGQLKVRRLNDKLVNYDEVVNQVDDYQAQELPDTYVEDAYIDFLTEEKIKEWIKEYDDAMSSFREALE